MTRTRQSGFTLIELLVVTILGTLLAVGGYQIISVTQRTHSMQAAQVSGQQALRAALAVLYAELREVSPSDGDLIAMERDSVTIRAMRQVGYTCFANYFLAPPKFTLRQAGQWLEVGDSVVAFADNDPSKMLDDVWVTGVVTAVDTTATCTGLDRAQLITVQGLPPADSIRPGATIRSYAQYTYGLFEFNGQPFLGRRSPGASPQPLVGPLRGKSEGGLVFTYLDANNAPALTPTDVAQVQVELRTASGIRGPSGRIVSDSIVTRIYPRN